MLSVLSREKLKKKNDLNQKKWITQNNKTQKQHNKFQTSSIFALIFKIYLL